MWTCTVALLVSAVAHVAGQQASSDTVQLDLPTTERRFLSGNLALEAQKFAIEEHRANVRQAGLWDNPNFRFEQNIYNQETGAYFPTGHDGQIAFEVQQLFLLAGKRGKRVQVERTNTEIAEHNFHDLLRTLRNQLRVSFYELYYSQRLLGVYDKEIGQMRNTVHLFQAQYQKGNISEKELIRLKALLLSLENDRRELNNQVIEKLGDLSLLSGDTTHKYVVPTVDTGAIGRLVPESRSLTALLDSASERRDDLKALDASLRVEQENLSLQNALAIPDVKVGFMFDRNASYIPDYKALTLEIDLPLFNRNQGNVEAAEFRVRSSQAQLEEYRLRVGNEVRTAYLKAQEIDRLYRNVDTRISADFDGLMDGTVQNYEKGNMSVLEFTDFFESYKNTMVDFYKLSSDRVKAFEELNYATGTIIYGE